MRAGHFVMEHDSEMQEGEEVKDGECVNLVGAHLNTMLTGGQNAGTGRASSVQVWEVALQ